MNVVNMLVNFQTDLCHIKREILDKKLEVKKLVFKSFFLKLSWGNSYHRSLDRQKSVLLGDVLNIYVPPLGLEIIFNFVNPSLITAVCPYLLTQNGM